MKRFWKLKKPYVMLWSIQYNKDKKDKLLTLHEMNKRWLARMHIIYKKMVPALH